MHVGRGGELDAGFSKTIEEGYAKGNPAKGTVATSEKILEN